MKNDQVLIYGYEKITIDGVLKTYNMLEELDKVKNDEEFWEVFYRIEASYRDIDEAMKNYFELLIRTGGTVKGCSLFHEFKYGIYCLDEKYSDIRDIVGRFS